VSLFVLRDAQGIIRLALASAGGVLYRARERADDPWQLRDEMDVPDLARILRAYNYVGDEARRGTPASAGELAELRARFAIPSAAPVQRHGEGDRVIPATIAAPGWAAGFTRFHAAGQLPADLDGAVLFAPALRPEDAPALRHASAIVSTGGGILSHVGLVALELGKPAVILDARWSVAESGAPALLYRRPQWREELSEIGPYRVVCRHDLHETEETLVPGDLVAVDAEAGSVIVLGHGAHAVSLHQDLHQLESASEALAGPRSDAEILACRGRLIRATHQLDRLLARIDGPALARHAVRELLTFPRGPFAAEGRRARTQLLATLLRNRACEREARTAAEQRVADLRARVEAARRSALEDVPHLENPGEVLYLQLRVRRMADTLADAAGLLAGAGEPFPHRLVAEVEDACRGRLSELREELTARAAGCAGEPSARSRLRHLVARLRQVDRALEGVEAPETARLAAELARTDAARRDELGRRAVLEARDGGLELRPLVGGKAAHLAEIVAVLGDAAVPPWFVVSDAAFRAALALPAPAARLEALRLGAAASLADAIAQATARAEWDAGRQAAAIRELWQDVALPAPLVEELGAAYLRLASPGGGDPLVAIRSSAREEDAEAAAWAGQFDTFLFVRGAAAVLEHLRLAWAGFWTERAIRHRRALRLPPEARGGGVIVQRMIEPRASGVLHTVSAASGQLREMVVNAGLGVGEGIVSGTVDVDHVTVSKAGGPDPPELQLRYRVGDKREQLVHDVERGGGTRRVATRYHQRFRPALEYVELRELVRAGALLERTFLTPLDIEFAVDGRGVHVVQARPVPLFDAAWRETIAGPPGEARPGPGEEPP
jgi:pyruvate,water dikinase